MRQRARGERAAAVRLGGAEQVERLQVGQREGVGEGGVGGEG